MPLSRRREFITQLSATPPAIARRRSPLASRSQAASESTVSSSDVLQRRGEIEVALLERRAAAPARAEQRFGVEGIDHVLAVGADVDVLAQRRLQRRRAERGERHHLVLVARVQEAEVGGDLLVEQAERVRHLDLPRLR